ncbi:MAG: hypothetical protein RMJ33_05225 [Saprospiraceae bacterium]|nr:hypothetical protein [Saprospiraceae bacterium]MDW8229222.1 hypothetical protein [Saprospiraceae bacterium]
MGFWDIFDSRDKKKRLSHIKNLIVLACADGEVDKNELGLIFRIGINAGLTPEELNRILERPDSVKFYPPESYKERIEHLYDMVMVMMVDGEINEGEMAFCKVVAMELGFSHEIIDQMVRDLVEMVARGLALEVALQRLGVR